MGNFPNSHSTVIAGEASGSLPSPAVRPPGAGGGTQGRPVREGKTRPGEPPTGAPRGLTTGKLVTQAPTSKHVPPPPRTAGCRRCFLQTSGRASPGCSHPPSPGSAHTAHPLPREKGLCPGGVCVSASLVPCPSGRPFLVPCSRGGRGTSAAACCCRDTPMLQQTSSH